MAKHHSKTSSKLKNSFHQIVGVAIVVAVGILGAYLIVSSHAASPFATTEAEKGTPSSLAATVTDNSANSGKAVQFGTTASSRPPGLVQAANNKTNCIYVNSVTTALTAFEQLTGMTFNCVGAFYNGIDTWNDWVAPFEFSDGDGWDQWLAANPTGRNIVLGMDLVPECPTNPTATSCSAGVAGNDNNPLTWETACDAGQYNAHATQLAQNLVSNGWGYTVIRLGDEMNGGTSEADFTGTTTQEQQDWALCFQQEVTAMRAVSGAHFLFDWNPNAGYQNNPFANYYPGNAYVDIIGADAYDSDWDAAISPPPSAATVNEIFSDPGGLNAIQAFATLMGKPMSLPEWGLWPTSGGGLGDDPFYINGIANYVKTNNVSFQDYFDDGGAGVPELNSSVPNSLAAYISQFK